MIQEIPRKVPKIRISSTGGGILINVFFGGDNFGTPPGETSTG